MTSANEIHAAIDAWRRSLRTLNQLRSENMPISYSDIKERDARLMKLEGLVAISRDSADHSVIEAVARADEAMMKGGAE